MRKSSTFEIVIRVFLFCSVAFTICPSRATAQVVKGSISGSVVDQSGGAVPGAEVRATNKDTGQESNTRTEAAGSFRLPLLPVGTYNLQISKPGFQKLALSNVEVNAGQDTGFGSLKLEVGQVTTTVEVSAAPPLLHVTESQVSTTIKGSSIATFPGVTGNEGLDFLALQIPGVVRSRGNNFSNANGVGFASNGVRGRNNDQQIDGQNNNDNSVAGPSLFLGNPDFVQEYQITTNNFGPEYGRNSGSVVNIITRSGSNTLHGDVFAVESNSKLNTLSNTQKAFEGLNKLPVSNEEFSGASVGGPIVRDKVFFFGGFDDDISPGSAVYSTGNLTPTPTGLSQLASCFPNSPSVKALQQFGPYGVTGGNPVPNGTPTTRTITAADGSPCTVQLAGVQRALTTPTHQYDILARGDLNTNKNRIYGRYVWQKITPLNQNSFTAAGAATGYPNNVPSFGEDIGLSWVRNLSATMVNEARVSYGRLTVEFGGNGIGNTIPPQGQIDQALARINMPSGFASFGPASNAPQGRIVNTYQFQDNWTYIRGRHQIKAGANLTYQRSPNAFLPNVNGTFQFTSFQNFASDIPTSVSVTLGNPILDFREHDSFFYVGDDFKVRSNLTLNLGLTWSYFGQPANLFNNLDVPRESNASTAFFNPSLPLSIRTFPELPTPKNNWGPNVGFAYSPQWGGRWWNGKTAFRGGYRISYDPGFYNIYLNIATATPQVLAQTLTAANAAANPLLAQPFGPAVRSQLSSFLVKGVADPRSFNQTTVTPDFRSDRVHSWSFGVQRELSPNAVAEVRYAGNHGTDLFQSINANPLISGIAARFPSALPSGLTPCPAANAVVPQATGRVNCNLGVDRVRANTAASDYHALQTEFRASNLWHQLTLRTAYTWSKTTDNVSEIFGTGSASTSSAFSQNPLDFVQGEHGLSGLHVPNSWTLSFEEQIPAFRDQHGVVGHVLGGWAVAASYIVNSGQPYSPLQFSLNDPRQILNLFDPAFNNAFNVAPETARPFLSNPSAPPDSVGVFAADLCTIDGSVGCGMPATTLLSFNSYNISKNKSASTIDKNSVRFIVNGLQADTVFGTPFGSAGRNILRDYHINTANFALYKFIKVTERVKARFDMTMLNVFNHPSFGSVGRSDIDPFIDDAGLAGENNGFANPRLYSGGNLSGTGGQRQIKFGLRVNF